MIDFRNIVVRCNTNEEKKFVLKQFYKHGLVWKSGLKEFTPSALPCTLIVRNNTGDWKISWDDYLHFENTTPFRDFLKLIKPKFIEVQE